MRLVLQICWMMALAIFLLSGVTAGLLFWEFNYGDCKDGCAEGMAYALFLPALLASGASACIALICHFLGKRMK